MAAFFAVIGQEPQTNLTQAVANQGKLMRKFWYQAAVTAVMMTTAIKPAISPYSIAVAPDWSFEKRESKFLTGLLQINEVAAYLYWQLDSLQPKPQRFEIK